MTTPKSNGEVEKIDAVEVMNIRHRVLHELDPDFTEYTPDQGMPPVVWKLNDAQIDYIIQSTLTAYAQAIREEERERIEGKLKEICDTKKFRAVKPQYGLGVVTEYPVQAVSIPDVFKALTPDDSNQKSV